jgi:hypothetical protein
MLWGYLARSRKGSGASGFDLLELSALTQQSPLSFLFTIYIQHFIAMANLVLLVFQYFFLLFLLFYMFRYICFLIGCTSETIFHEDYDLDEKKEL